jgi:hypothetical protein
MLNRIIEFLCTLFSPADSALKGGSTDLCRSDGQRSRKQERKDNYDPDTICNMGGHGPSTG